MRSETMSPSIILYRSKRENAILKCVNPVIGPDACCETLEDEEMCNTCWLGERIYWMETPELEPFNYHIDPFDDFGGEGYDTERWFADNTSTPLYWKRYWNYENAWCPAYTCLLFVEVTA
jgi:hypothetical protein